MAQLDAISRPANVQKFVAHIAIKRRQTWHELATLLEVQAIQEVEHDA